MKHIAVIILAVMLTVCAVQGQTTDSTKSVYIVDTFKVQQGILIAKDGTGFVPFRNITIDQLKYIFQLIAYFEQGNKLKKELESR